MSKSNKSPRPILKFTVKFALVVLFVGFIALITIPNFVRPKSDPAWYANRCINNLRQIDAAAKQFALEHHLTNGAPINFPNDLTPYVKLTADGYMPQCPVSRGIYHVSKVGEPATCSLGSTVTPAHVLP